jgi:hypothetical protein
MQNSLVTGLQQTRSRVPGKEIAVPWSEKSVSQRGGDSRRHPHVAAALDRAEAGGDDVAGAAAHEVGHAISRVRATGTSSHRMHSANQSINFL